MAPEMSATVMIANVAWKPTKAIDGYAAWMFEDCASSKAWPRPIWFQSMLKNPTTPETAVPSPWLAKAIA
jgi:hypothetical protein